MTATVDVAKEQQQPEQQGEARHTHIAEPCQPCLRVIPLRYTKVCHA